MRLDELRAIEDPLERARLAEEAGKRAVEYHLECLKIRDIGMRQANKAGKGPSYQQIADHVKVSKSTAAGACKGP